jgi:hypothetical protein
LCLCASTIVPSHSGFGVIRPLSQSNPVRWRRDGKEVTGHPLLLLHTLSLSSEVSLYPTPFSPQNSFFLFQPNNKGPRLINACNERPKERLSPCLQKPSHWGTAEMSCLSQVLSICSQMRMGSPCFSCSRHRAQFLACGRHSAEVCGSKGIAEGPCPGPCDRKVSYSGGRAPEGTVEGLLTEGLRGYILVPASKSKGTFVLGDGFRNKASQASR